MISNLTSYLSRHIALQGLSPGRLAWRQYIVTGREDRFDSVSVSAQNGNIALGKAHTRSAQSLSSLPEVPFETVPIYLVEHRSSSTLEGGMSAASFLHSSFLQAINAVMLWPVHVEKVPQASEHLCPAKLQTRCDICCACQSICPFIPSDSGVPRTVDPQKCIGKDCAWLCSRQV